MIVQINDRFLGEVATGRYHGKLPFSVEVARGFIKRLNQLRQAKSTQDLRNLKSLHFEKLKEKRYDGKHSVRINESYRIIFQIDKQDGVEIIGIDEISNHYST